MEDAKMKLRNKVATGVVGAVSLLSLAITSSHAANPAICTNGTISKVSAGYSFTAPAGKFYQITFACADTGWVAAPNNTYRFVPEAGAVFSNLDGMYATALTALATTKNVEVTLYTWPSDVTTSIGTFKMGTYVVNVTVK
jgi:hypothetical protein